MTIKLIRKPARIKWLNLNKELSNLHNTTRRFLLYGRVVGLLPLLGLTSQTSNKLRYTLRSPYTIYHAFSLFGQVVMCLCAWLNIFRTGYSSDNLSNLIFYTASLASFFLVTKTGWCWPILMRTVVKMENQLPSFRKNYNTVVHVVMACIVTAGAVEEILFTIYRLIRVYSCTSHNLTQNYFKVNGDWIFDYTPDIMWKGFFFEIFRIQAGIIWNYNDWLLIVLSLYLAEHFAVHNERLKKAMQQKKFSCIKYRIEYLKIVHIVKLINGRFDIFLMISVGGNLYWICIQLFYTLNDGLASPNLVIVCESEYSEKSELITRKIHLIYYIFSFCYVVIRSFLVLQIAARIQSNALVLVFTLYDSPSSKFNVEVQRYISQIKNIKIGLSGFHFFLVTRNMILSILGSIVTFELVMFQFAK